MNLLNKHPLYCFLSPQEIDHLKTVIKKQHYHRGDTIIQTGNRSRDIICMEKGRVSIRIFTSEGDSREVAQVQEGNLIGEMNFIIPTRRTANAVALTDVEADILPYDQLCNLLKAEPLLAYKVFAAMNRQLRDKFMGMLE